MFDTTFTRKFKMKTNSNASELLLTSLKNFCGTELKRKLLTKTIPYRSLKGLQIVVAHLRNYL